VVNPTTTTLSISPEAPSIGAPVTLTATVTGAADGDTVEFLDGTSRLGTGTVSSGVATLAVTGGFKAGDHSLTATFAQTGAAGASTSNAVAFTLVKGTSTTVITLSAASTAYGHGATGRVTVGGADGGTVTLGYGSTESTLTLDGHGSAAFQLPATLAVGRYTLTAAYSGTDAVAAGTSTATYTVAKASPSIRLAAPKKVRKGRTATVTVTVTGASGALAPSGRVTVRVGAIAKTATVSGGKATVRIKVKVRGKGKRKVTATYAGDARYLTGSTSARLTVR
jgi:hypothetical protein